MVDQDSSKTIDELVSQLSKQGGNVPPVQSFAQSRLVPPPHNIPVKDPQPLSVTSPKPPATQLVPPTLNPLAPKISVPPPPPIPKVQVPPVPSVPSFRPQSVPLRVPLVTSPSVRQPPVMPKPAGEVTTSIRTMADDLSSLKSGKTPTGTEARRMVLPSSPPPSSAVPSRPQSVSLPSSRTPEVRLGEMQKSTPLSSLPAKTPPPLPQARSGELPTPQVRIPNVSSHRGLSSKFYIILVVILLLLGGAYWFFSRSNTSEPVVNASPTPEPSLPTPTPFSITRQFGAIQDIQISRTAAFLSELQRATASQSLGGRMVHMFHLVDENGQPYRLDEFFSRAGVPFPQAALPVVQTPNWYFGLFGQFDDVTQLVTKRPLLLAEAKSVAQANDAMTQWEPTLPDDFSNLFLYDPVRKETPTMLSDTYGNVNFRFIRIPDSTNGVAYAAFDHYLLFASSKDSFRAVLDGLAPSLTLPSPLR